ncbi:MAG: membrane-bound lytic murein transglycosylase MltF [Betaproteobacteria bacterium]|nr:membrane-bound lytic murein transglycosylase MltF [Betaproteobacteria bacterium]
MRTSRKVGIIGLASYLDTRLRLFHIILVNCAALLVATVIMVAISFSHSHIEDFRELGELRVATRIDSLSYREDERGTYAGFEHDLLVALGQRLGVPVRFVPYPDTEHALRAVINGEAHLAAAGLTPDSDLPLAWTTGLREIDFVLVGRTSRSTILRDDDLAGRIVTVRQGTKLAVLMETLKQRIPGLKVVHPAPHIDDQNLLMQVASGQIDLLATDQVNYALAKRLAPTLAIIYDLPSRSTVSWAMPLQTGEELSGEVNRFLDESAGNGLLASTADRYFGHIRRLDYYDVTVFLKRVQDRLPRYISYFKEAGKKASMDWRYLAAVSYQESHWDPEATSYTGVRGMMMLTVDTANRLGVENRLDPKQSILGGALYLSMLQSKLPKEVLHPDRMWMTTAAYNIGPGGINNARALARMLGKNDTMWVDLKSVLPLLAQPQYATQFKTGPVRGGEALIMAENVRNFYDILCHNYPAEHPTLAEADDERPPPVGFKFNAQATTSAHLSHTQPAP